MLWLLAANKRAEIHRDTTARRRCALSTATSEQRALERHETVHRLESFERRHLHTAVSAGPDQAGGVQVFQSGKGRPPVKQKTAFCYASAERNAAHFQTTSRAPNADDTQDPLHNSFTLSTSLNYSAHYASPTPALSTPPTTAVTRPVRRCLSVCPFLAHVVVKVVLARHCKYFCNPRPPPTAGTTLHSPPGRAAPSLTLSPPPRIPTRRKVAPLQLCAATTFDDSPQSHEPTSGEAKKKTQLASVNAECGARCPRNLENPKSAAGSTASARPLPAPDRAGDAPGSDPCTWHWATRGHFRDTESSRSRRAARHRSLALSIHQRPPK